MQCVAVCCSVLQRADSAMQAVEAKEERKLCVAMCCSVLHNSEGCCSDFWCVTVRCGVLWCVACATVCCGVLRCVVVCCCVLQCDQFDVFVMHAGICSVLLTLLQHTATYCLLTLLRGALCCNVL